MTTGERSAFTGIDIPSDAILNNCIHCGLCLPTCPTYSITGLERSSPRGRIRLIKAVAEGISTISKEFIYEMNFCLDCQACESACPAGIKYGSLVEAARAQIHQGKYENKIAIFSKKFLLSWLFAKHSRLKMAARLLRLIQKLVSPSFIDFGIKSKLLPAKLFNIYSLAPKISSKYSTDTLSERILPNTNPRYRIIFLTGCIMDVAFADVNEDTIQLLLHHGCEVIVPSEQKCCGSLQAHNGDIRGAQELALYNIELFNNYEFDYIIMNSAGCGAFMKEYGKIFENNSVVTHKAKSICNSSLRMSGSASNRNVRFKYVRSPQKRKDFRRGINDNNEHERDGPIENDSKNQRRQNHDCRSSREPPSQRAADVSCNSTVSHSWRSRASA